MSCEKYTKITFLPLSYNSRHWLLFYFNEFSFQVDSTQTLFIKSFKTAGADQRAEQEVT